MQFFNENKCDVLILTTIATNTCEPHWKVLFLYAGQKDQCLGCTPVKDDAKNSVRLRLLRVDDANQFKEKITRHQQGMCDLSLCGCPRRDWGRRGPQSHLIITRIISHENITKLT